ncbi:hypothetical protein BK727_13120 [Bacillus thuringiensis serovar roskildiensis]|uniref:Uncharacterized protein n=1 Tax=Bacillus thuringiensis serovar sooncheon TaxID=180891 RepID=A0A9Q5SCK5_BACTU|nr:hypothetical protein [Bacillus thuringiensis]OTW70615.1 hypothetical protein BK707_11405 [Bacillus thuringiensis serovar coreanensis]OTX42261.1 hypothetical protein BK724_26085 [Bacillus thuringiensis serovar sooncheon]OTX60276.1 hypothetical protein BK725_00995 [Bacillus thuringiensis serovar guiyangiensis]OTX69142.1 hypothetical protein BK727_13120 [Bacillus thuringiensis serovar roskildiensis]
MTNKTKMTKEDFINILNKMNKSDEMIDLTKASEKTNTLVHTFMLWGLVLREELIDEIAMDIYNTMNEENEHQAIHTLEEKEGVIIFISKYEDMEVVSELDFENGVLTLETN